MRLYLAGCENGDAEYALSGLKDLSLLFSYFYISKRMNRVDWAINNNIPLFLDSGAFSAMHSGANIDINAYIDFIKEHGTKFEKVAALDCIGDWNGTEKNLQYMRSKGVNPIPVFHTNEPFDYLENLLKENDYLCLGVTGSKLRQPQIIAWLVEVFRRREHINPDCKMHGFALTSAKIMKYFDWDSCDSSTWVSGRRFGFIYDIENNNMASYSRDRWYKIKNKYPSNLFISRKPTLEESNVLIRHNAEIMLEYVRRINTLKGKAVVSPRPTV